MSGSSLDSCLNLLLWKPHAALPRQGWGDRCWGSGVRGAPARLVGELEAPCPNEQGLGRAPSLPLALTPTSDQQNLDFSFLLTPEVSNPGSVPHPCPHPSLRAYPQPRWVITTLSRCHHKPWVKLFDHTWCLGSLGLKSWPFHTCFHLAPIETGPSSFSPLSLIGVNFHGRSQQDRRFVGWVLKGGPFLGRRMGFYGENPCEWVRGSSDGSATCEKGKVFRSQWWGWRGQESQWLSCEQCGSTGERSWKGMSEEEKNCKAISSYLCGLARQKGTREWNVWVEKWWWNIWSLVNLGIFLGKFCSFWGFEPTTLCKNHDF